MTFFVTGAAGFIGAVTIRRLLSKGYRVVAIDNFNAYYDPALKRHRLADLHGHSALTLLEGDIRDRNTLDTIFAQHAIDGVINLAAMAGVRSSIENPFLYSDVNSTGFLQLLESMRRHGVKKIALASTSSLYAGLTMPFNEEQDVRKPISPYAASKLAAEAMGHVYSEIHGFNVFVLRYFTVYGPAGRPDMAIFKFIESCIRGDVIELFGDGQHTRDFTFVEDIAEGTVRTMEAELDGFHMFNLGGGNTPTSMLDLIRMIASEVGCSPKILKNPPIQADMLHTGAAVERAKKWLNWSASTSLNEGIRRTVQWHLAHRDLLDRLTPFN